MFTTFVLNIFYWQAKRKKEQVLSTYEFLSLIKHIIILSCKVKKKIIYLSKSTRFIYEFVMSGKNANVLLVWDKCT